MKELVGSPFVKAMKIIVLHPRSTDMEKMGNIKVLGE